MVPAVALSSAAWIVRSGASAAVPRLLVRPGRAHVQLLPIDGARPGRRGGRGHGRERAEVDGLDAGHGGHVAAGGEAQRQPAVGHLGVEGGHVGVAALGREDVHVAERGAVLGAHVEDALAPRAELALGQQQLDPEAPGRSHRQLVPARAEPLGLEQPRFAGPGDTAAGAPAPAAGEAPVGRPAHVAAGQIGAPTGVHPYRCDRAHRSLAGGACLGEGEHHGGHHSRKTCGNAGTHWDRSPRSRAPSGESGAGRKPEGEACVPSDRAVPA